MERDTGDEQNKNCIHILHVLIGFDTKERTEGCVQGVGDQMVPA